MGHKRLVNYETARSEEEGGEHHESSKRKGDGWKNWKIPTEMLLNLGGDVNKGNLLQQRPLHLAAR